MEGEVVEKAIRVTMAVVAREITTLVRWGLLNG